MTWWPQSINLEGTIVLTQSTQTVGRGLFLVQDWLVTVMLCTSTSTDNLILHNINNVELRVAFNTLVVEAPDSSTIPSWKRATYELVFRDPQILLDHQISNPDFKNHIDYAPHLVYGEKGQRVWSDFMTGNWAWNQCVSKYFFFILIWG